MNKSATARSFAALRMTALVSTAIVILTCRASTLEIPVENIATPSGSAVGFIDMEKIFQEFPETQRAKAEYLSEIDKKRGILLDRELELKKLKDRIDILKSAVEKSTGTLDSQTGRLAEPAVALTLRQQELSDKEKELEKERLKTEQELVDYERRRSQTILGRIYAVLRELAEEAQISVVVDKSYVLYGTSQVDLTDKLRDRLRTE